MRSIINIIFVASMLGAMLAPTVPAYAYEHVKLQQVAYFQSGSLKVRSPQQAAQLVKQRYGGKVLKVQRTQVNGNSGYRVKLLKANGQITSYSVDAKTGRISGR